MDDLKTIELFPKGTVKLPSSKSYGHRAMICAALASHCSGESRIISNVTMSEDMHATIRVLQALGFACEHSDNGSLKISGQLSFNGGFADAGESGSTLRFFIPIAALINGESTFTGSKSLLARPLEAFLSAGLNMDISPDFVKVTGPLKAGSFSISGNVSSQFISGLLFALPLLDNSSEIILTSPLESSAYVDMTIDVMKTFGVTIEKTPTGYYIKGSQKYTPTDYAVEGDFSQAAFFLGAAALGRDVKCAGLNPHSIQGDKAILDILCAMGQQVLFDNGVYSVQSAPLKPIELDVREFPDLVPPVAAVMCFCNGASKIVNAARLRIKECDRLAAMAAELSAIGADITEGDDYLVIKGNPVLNGGTAFAHNDHRVAMALAVAAIRCKNPVTIRGYNAVNKSYPDFWQDFEKEAL